MPSRWHSCCLFQFMSIRLRSLALGMNHPVKCSDWWGPLAEEILEKEGHPYDSWTYDKLVEYKPELNMQKYKFAWDFMTTEYYYHSHFDQLLTSHSSRSVSRNATRHSSEAPRSRSVGTCEVCTIDEGRPIARLRIEFFLLNSIENHE